MLRPPSNTAACTAWVLAICWRCVVLCLLNLCVAGWQSAAAAPLRVITSIPPVTDLVRQVGGDAIRLQTLVPAGVSSHTFQPTPGDVQYLTQADLVILNGLNLELAIEKLLRCCGNPKATLLKLGDHTISQEEWMFGFSFPKSQGNPNPHLWLDVEIARRYVELIRDQLCVLDPEHDEQYRSNAIRTLDHLSHLDRCITTAIGTIPPHARNLVTYMDAWPYFAKRYGLNVLAVVQPANFAEPSAREVARIVEQLRKGNVPAIFGSEIFPSKVPEKIAREAGVRYITPLHDEVLPGVPGEPKHSYYGMMELNVATIVVGLGGDRTVFEQCLQDRAGR
ncbi:MAG: metal ABC transporter substrate-binding protein [Candidatus Entotheonellia bacterium]